MRIVYETTTDKGQEPVRIWLDGLLSWKMQPLSSPIPIQPDSQVWTAPSLDDEISKLLSPRERQFALDAVDVYLPDLLREVNAVFSDSTDPFSGAWEHASHLLLQLSFGLSNYYLSEANLVDRGSHEARPLYAPPSEITLGPGASSFALLTVERHEQDFVTWAEFIPLLQQVIGTDPEPEATRLAHVLKCTTGLGITEEIVRMHSFAVVHLAEELRYVVNKLRAGVAITQRELGRLSSFSQGIGDFQGQLREAAGMFDLNFQQNPSERLWWS